MASRAHLGVAILVAAFGVAACGETVGPRPGPSSVDVLLSEATATDDVEGSALAEGVEEPASGEMVAAATAMGARASGEGVVLPNAYAYQMGNFNNRFPHAMHNMRYQQVFPSYELGALRVVSALCLRRDETSGGAAQTQRLTIKMGPSLKDHMTLGPVFDANYASAPTTVFSGDVALPANSGRGTVDDFYVCIDFDRTYRHPEGANVIVEIVNTSTTSLGHFSDACSRTVNAQQCTTRRAYAMSATAATATGVFNSGLIMKFIGRAGTTTSKTNETFPFDAIMYGCTEPIQFSGSIHIVTTQTTTASGNMHFMTHAQPQALSGVGLLSGARYQGTGATINSAHIGMSGSYNSSFVNNFRLIGQGPDNNLLIHENFHVTFNANGELTAIHDNFSFDCK